jgi:hypothetical protein
MELDALHSGSRPTLRASGFSLTARWGSLVADDHVAPLVKRTRQVAVRTGSTVRAFSYGRYYDMQVVGPAVRARRALTSVVG